MKKIIKKITTRSVEKTVKEDSDRQEQPQRKRGCVYCSNEQLPSYTDIATLKRFLSDRSKILPKTYTHLCSKHQRGATRNIKYARHLALLPFTPKV